MEKNAPIVLREDDMKNTTTSKENAIAAGFWIKRDYGMWSVGHGRGSEVTIIHKREFKRRADAMDAMVEAWRYYRV